MADLAILPGAGLSPLNLMAAVAAIETPADAKAVVDMAAAFQACAKRAGAGLEVQNAGAEAKLRAEREGGRLLLESGVGRGVKSVTLADFGVNESKSARWQRIASLPEAEFEAYIAAAYQAEKELTTAGALHLARTIAASREPGKPPLHVVPADTGLPGLDGVFSTLVADPPWQYDNRGTRNAARKHYETLTVDEVCDLPIEVHAAEQAHLYLWTTNAFLRAAFAVMEAWGFTYKCHLAWVKPQMGMGNYFRVSHEHVLFGVRGGLGTQRKDVKSWFSAARTKHSAKPESFYGLVEASSPGPYLDLFTRQKRLGWTGCGGRYWRRHRRHHADVAAETSCSGSP